MHSDDLWWERQRSSLARAYAEENPSAVAERLREVLTTVSGEPDEEVPDNVVAFLDAAYLLAESGNLPRSRRAWRLAMFAMH
jgi:hypothetical protein